MDRRFIGFPLDGAHVLTASLRLQPSPPPSQTAYASTSLDRPSQSPAIALGYKDGAEDTLKKGNRDDSTPRRR
jgi:hypothetical protein